MQEGPPAAKPCMPPGQHSFMQRHQEMQIAHLMTDCGCFGPHRVCGDEGHSIPQALARQHAGCSMICKACHQHLQAAPSCVSSMSLAVRPDGDPTVVPTVWLAAETNRALDG